MCQDKKDFAYFWFVDCGQRELLVCYIFKLKIQKSAKNFQIYKYYNTP